MAMSSAWFKAHGRSLALSGRAFLAIVFRVKSH